VSPTAVPAAKIPYPVLFATWNSSQLPGPVLLLGVEFHEISPGAD
jgi:hypothetical protein